MLEIKDLHASVEGNEILKGISLSIKKGEIHAVMGPNGSGKSTLAKILSGHPSYEPTGGEILLEGKNLFDMDAKYCDVESEHDVLAYLTSLVEEGGLAAEADNQFRQWWQGPPPTSVGF